MDEDLQECVCVHVRYMAIFENVFEIKEGQRTQIFECKRVQCIE